MRYTVTKQIIQVVGRLWMPDVVAATEYTLTEHDMSNLGDPHNRDDVEHWLLLHSGDFQSITDFRADFTVDNESIIHEWKNEESEFTFSDCMYPSEE